METGQCELVSSQQIRALHAGTTAVSPSQETAVGICAVIVTFNPDLPNLVQVLGAVRDDVEHVVVVDKPSGELDEQCLREISPGLILERLPTNIGIAAAQNKGVEIARHRGAVYVLFLD